MQIKHEFSHDIDLVFNTLTNKDFLTQRALYLGSVEANCETSGTEPDCQIKLIRRREINVPAVLAAFVKKVQIATTNEAWEKRGDDYTCQNATEIDGAPLSISGQMKLTPSSTGCVYIADFETKAKIMFGKKNLQAYAGKTIAKEIELECQYTEKYLDSL